MNNLEVSCRQKCNECSYKLTHQIDYKEVPEILVLEYPCTNIKASHRIISIDGTIWYNNSIEDGHLSTTSYKQLKTCNGKILVLAIYA